MKKVKDDCIFLIGNALLRLSEEEHLPPGLLNKCLCDFGTNVHVQTQSMTGLFCLLIAQLCLENEEGAKEWLDGDRDERSRTFKVIGYNGDWNEYVGKEVEFTIIVYNVPKIFSKGMTFSLVDLLGRFLKYDHSPDIKPLNHPAYLFLPKVYLENPTF